MWRQPLLLLVLSSRFRHLAMVLLANCCFVQLVLC
jgi:hypothetical protein